MTTLQRSWLILRAITPRTILVLGNVKGNNFEQTRKYSDGEAQATKQTLFQKLWDHKELPAHTNAHSKTLTSNVATYEFQFEDVKPEFMEKYLEESAIMSTKLNEDESYPGRLIGSWTSVFGEQDKAVNLWVYPDGYKGISKQMKYNKENQELKEFNIRKNAWLHSRTNELCHEFSYWGEPHLRKHPHIYELRTYALKPGTLIEWGNKWSTAINIRRKDAVAGFFSQIGDLYLVHHLWAYYDMQHRKEERENMWQIPGWDDCVAATVPLVRQMKAQILLPTPNSPMQ